MRGTALVKCIFLFIDFKGHLDSGTHMVNARHGQMSPQPSYFGDFGIVI